MTLPITFSIFIVLAFSNLCNSVKNSRILNGVGATNGQFPYAIYIVLKSSGCTGSLIKADKVLTAAHCYQEIPAGCTSKTCFLGTCFAGEVNVKRGKLSESKTMQTRLVGSVIIHPGFQGQYVPNDVAILTMKLPFRLNYYVATIRLAKKETLKLNDTVICRGFGRQKFGDSKPAPTDLAWITSEVFKFGCAYGQTICTKIEGKGTYSGDSGGPLIRSVNQHVMYGVASIILNHYRPFEGTAYASVIENREWIMKNLIRSRMGKRSNAEKINAFGWLILTIFICLPQIFIGISK